MEKSRSFHRREALVFVDHGQPVLDERITDLARESRAAILLAVEAERQAHHNHLGVRVREQREQPRAIRPHASSLNRGPRMGDGDLPVGSRDPDCFRPDVEPDKPRHWPLLTD